jgi:hypothetical protein
MKKAWLSKTMWINLLMAVGAMFFPPMSDFMSSNPEAIGFIWGAVNMLLRFVTKDQITLTD